MKYLLTWTDMDGEREIEHHEELDDVIKRIEMVVDDDGDSFEVYEVSRKLDVTLHPRKVEVEVN